MKKSLHFLALLLIMLSCKKTVVEEPVVEERIGAGTVQTARLSNVYLSVEVVSATVDKIKGDGLGLVAPNRYVHDQQNVRAELQSTNGDLYMVTNWQEAKPAQRFLNFPGNEDLENKNEYRIRISDRGNSFNIQTMTEGTSEFMHMHLFSYSRFAEKLLDIHFNATTHVGTDNVIVTRTGPNTWEVVPNGTAMAKIVRQDGTPEETESMPFKFILTRKSGK